MQQSLPNPSPQQRAWTKDLEQIKSKIKTGSFGLPALRIVPHFHLA
jgi:hypothetical protein